MSTEAKTTGEEESRKVAEDSREKEWAGRTFVREMFLGNFIVDLIHPFPTEGEERPEFTKFYNDLRTFLRDDVDRKVRDIENAIGR